MGHLLPNARSLTSVTPSPSRRGHPCGAAARRSIRREGLGGGERNRGNDCFSTSPPSLRAREAKFNRPRGRKLPTPLPTPFGSGVLDASASAGVTSVVYQLSGGTLTNQVIATATPTVYGWIAIWDSTGVPNGTYQLQSVASYSGGGSGTSPPFTITVAN